MRKWIVVSSFCLMPLALAAAAASCSSADGAGQTRESLVAGQKCEALPGEVYQVCIVDETGAKHFGDVHDGGMPVIESGHSLRVVFAFEPAWAPDPADLSAKGAIATAFAAPKNVDSPTDPVPESDPAAKVASHVASWDDTTLTVAIDDDVQAGDQVEVQLDGTALYASRLHPCSLPGAPDSCLYGFGFNDRFYVGFVPPLSPSPSPSPAH
jgi:hypothetical protein